MQHGHFIEQLVAEFSSRFFMKDFVLLNPKYVRGGREKELADLLLVMDDTCIVVSLKSTDGKAKPFLKLQSWLAKNARRGMGQAKGGINWISRISFKGRDLWGDVREFRPDSLRPICGIVLLECSQEPYRPVEFAVELPESTVPLHFLSLNDFLNVVNWLGSIWDVFQYFL